MEAPAALLDRGVVGGHLVLQDAGVDVGAEREPRAATGLGGAVEAAAVDGLRRVRLAEPEQDRVGLGDGGDDGADGSLQRPRGSGKTVSVAMAPSSAAAAQTSSPKP